VAPKSIFIASAQETRSLASTVAQTLADNNYHPVRWWQEFPPGSITIERLLEIASTIDGAVFLCTATDKTWYRHDIVNSPRDNLLLEYGIFIAHLGRNKTIRLM
jgi:predicted nucleotide-binding protein